MKGVINEGDALRGENAETVAGGSVLKSRLKKAPPPNSLEYYRERAGKTLMEVAAALNTSHQTIQRLEKRQMILTPEWADRISPVIGGVPAQLIGFSYAPDAYMWAASAVPIVGTVEPDLHVSTADKPYRCIGVRNNPAGDSCIAIELGREALPPLAGWLILIDDTRVERMNRSVLERQNEMRRQFIVRIKDGTMWWRRIVPSAKRNFYHLEFDHKPTIYDVEIESVSEFVGFEPGLTLPPREELEQ